MLRCSAHRTGRTRERRRTVRTAGGGSKLGIQTGYRLPQPPCSFPSPQELLDERHYLVFKHRDKRQRAPQPVQLVLRILVEPGPLLVELEMLGGVDCTNGVIHRLRWIDTHAEIFEVLPALDKHARRVRLSVVENAATILTIWMHSSCRSTREPFFVQPVVFDGRVGFVPGRVRFPRVPRT